MAKLSVNLNKVALLRNQRRGAHPSLLRAAQIAINAGAHGLTVHPRLDERHIRRDDVVALAAMLKANDAGIELNVEGYLSETFLDLIDEIRPTQTTLVPDPPDALTSDHGWDIAANATELDVSLAKLKSYGTRTALFVDPDIDAVTAAANIGANRIELYTGPYAAAFAAGAYDAILGNYVIAAQTAKHHGLGVNAGHDLTRDNLMVLQQAIPWLDEISIGHYLTVDALAVGFDAAVAGFVDLIAVPLQN